MKISEIIINMINEKKKDDTHGKRILKNNEFYATSAGDCLRKVIYSRKFKKEKSVDALKNFEVGNIFHSYLQDIIKEGKHEIPIELTYKGITIYGRIDTLLNDEIYEFKTVSKLDFSYEPKLQHIYQIMIYLKAFNLAKGHIVYIEKNTLKTIEHDIGYDEKIMDKIIADFKIAEEYLNQDKLPSEHYCNSCMFCEYTEECNENSVNIR
jgi:CRISPR-associated exonuclease Cas4